MSAEVGPEQVDVTDRPGRQLGIVSGGGGGGGGGSTDVSLLNKEATQQDVLAAVEALATQATLAAIQTAIAGLAKDTSVDGVEALLTTLTGKDFATHATQVTSEALLTTLAGKDFATSAHQTSIEALLTSIDTHVQSESATVTNLKLDADQINLNTDTLEALITALNSKDFALEATQTAANTILTAINTKLGGTLAVSGPVTDAQLRASALPVSGPLTDTQLAARLPLSVTGPLTDTQLAARLPLSVDTELPAAAALSDTLANPTTPMLAAAAMLWDPTLNAAAGGWVRQAEARRADGGTKGVPGIGMMFWDASNSVYRMVESMSLGDAQFATSIPGFGLYGFNGATMDRLLVDASKRLNVTAIVNGTTINHSADALATNAFTIPGAVQYEFNGASMDRRRNTVNGADTLASGARTTAQSGADTTTYNLQKVRVSINVTAASGTGGLQLVIEGKEQTSGVYYALNATPTAVTATGLYIYEVFPGAGAASGGVTQRTGGMLPRIVRFRIIVGDSSSYTYSVNLTLAP